jgi:hypothetical protein
MPLIGNVDKVTHTYVAGWLADTDTPLQPVDVLVYVNGEGRGRVTADVPRDDLRTAFPGATGRHAFRLEFGWPLSPYRAHEVEVMDGIARRPIAEGRRTLQPIGTLHKTEPAPIFLSSAGRTGTSLLMGRLAAHPEIAVAGSHPYEVKLLTYYTLALRTLTLEANWNCSMNPDALASETSRYMIGFNPFHDPQFGVHPLLERYWDMTGHAILSPAFRDAVCAYYDTIRIVTNKLRIRYFAEKTHPGPLIRDGAIAMFGFIKEIVLVRDPRDMVCSYRAFWGRNPTEAVPLIRSQFLELAERLHASDSGSLLVRYEDLVLDPGRTLGRIWEFLEIEPAVPDRHDAEAAVFQTHGTSVSPRESIGRWQKELTNDEKTLCEQCFSAFLPNFGYNQ